MATLDDKLLGEKLQNYCSSSSEDEDNNSEEKMDAREKKEKSKAPKFIPESQLKDQEKNWSGGAQNTGPKGVIRDWQRYKQLQNEKNIESQTERSELIKKLALTCRSDEVDKEFIAVKEIENSKAAAVASAPCTDVTMEEIEKDLMSDEFFKEYIKIKMEEMRKKTQHS